MRSLTKNIESHPLEQIVSRGSVIVVDSALQYAGVVKKLRAVNLILNGRGYELVTRDDTPDNYRHFDVVGDPLVIALNRFVPNKRVEIPFDSYVSKRAVLSRDEYTCSYCGEYGDTVDHIVPKSQGGASTWGNLTTACRACNSKKANKSLKEVGFRSPKIPKSFVPRRNLVMQDAIHERLML